MVALAIAVAMYTLSTSFIRYGIPQEYAEKYVYTTAITGVVGARLWYLLEDPQFLLQSPFSAILSGAGFTFYGGFIFASLVYILMSKRDSLPMLKVLDASAPTLAIGYAIGRLGCQLSGDGDYGIITSSILGMSYSSGVIPTPLGTKVFPTPVYESIFACGVYLFLNSLEQKKLKSGLIFCYYLFLMSFERFFVEFIRVNPEAVSVFSQAQIIAIILMLISIIFYSRLVKNKFH
jgi:phosphatidylglycerol---prolipoprotein diacylglyceryl transferase